MELLVAMALMGVLMASLSMVMGQVVQNNDVLTEYLGVSNDMVTLRRLLHRDLRDVVGDVELGQDGFHLETTHNLLQDSPLPMKTTWRITEGKILRSEGNEDLSYNSTRVLMEGLQSWNMELFDYEMNNWYDLTSIRLAQREVEIGALRITIVDEKGQEKKMTERFPFAQGKE